MSDMKTLMENFRGYARDEKTEPITEGLYGSGFSPTPRGGDTMAWAKPGYGEGNLTMDDVRAVLQKIGWERVDPELVWDRFKHLNNADDLERDLLSGKGLSEAWEGESAATRRMAKRFTGGSIDIEPLSDEEQTASTEAYYELFEFLADSNLPGNKPSEKLQYALRWIAKFEQGGAAGEVGLPQSEETPEDDEQILRQRADGSYYYSSDEEERYTSRYK